MRAAWDKDEMSGKSGHNFKLRVNSDCIDSFVRCSIIKGISSHGSGSTRRLVHNDRMESMTPCVFFSFLLGSITKTTQKAIKKMSSSQEYLRCYVCSKHKSLAWKVDWHERRAYCTKCGPEPKKECIECKITRAPYWRKGPDDGKIRCNHCWLLRRGESTKQVL